MEYDAGASAGLPELLKTSEVAGLFGVSRSTVLSWAYRGLLDYATMPSGRSRFYRHQVQALLTFRQDAPDQAAETLSRSVNDEEA